MNSKNDVHQRWFAFFRSGIVYALLSGWMIVVYFPLYWTAITSFKAYVATLDATYVPWVDFTPTLDTWNEMLTGVQSRRIIQAFINSTIISLASATFAVVLGSMAGYGLARFHYRFGKWRNNEIAFWFISQRMMPPAAAVLAFMVMYRVLNLLDTQFGLILAYVSFNLPTVIWIMRDFLLQMPRDLEDSAMIDGASRLLAFWKVVVPLAAPSIVAVFIFSFIFTWNEYLFALILTFNNVATVPLLLAAQVTSIGVQWSKMAVLTGISLVPSIICAVLLERYIARGLLSGAIK